MNESALNVRSFGAAGDGVTDDRPAIQEALDTGRDVFMPDGHYRIHGALVHATLGQTLLGAGLGRTRLQQSLDGANAVTLANVTQPYPPGAPVGGARYHQRICDMSITRSSGTGGIGIEAGSGPSWCGDWPKIDRVQVWGFQTGVSIKSVAQARINDLMVNYCQTGVFIGGSTAHSHHCSAMSVDNCEVGLDYEGLACMFFLGDFVANATHVRVRGQGTFFGGNFESYTDRAFKIEVGVAALHGFRFLTGAPGGATEPIFVEDHAAIWIQDCYAYNLHDSTCLVVANGPNASVRGTLASVDSSLGSDDKSRMVRRADTGALYRIGQFDVRDEASVPAASENLSGAIVQTLGTAGVVGAKMCVRDGGAWAWKDIIT